MMSRPLTRSLILTTACGLSLLAGCVTPPPEAPKPPVLPGKVVTYACASGSKLVLTYGESKVTLPGNETLLAEDASNQRYSWPSDGTHHVWTLSGTTGTLLLRDGAKGTETVVQSGCKPVG